VLYCEKANNYLNIKEKNLDIYFRIALHNSYPEILADGICKYVLLIVAAGERCILRSARDLVVCECGLR
jgi:hypothetical protein